MNLVKFLRTTHCSGFSSVLWVLIAVQWVPVKDANFDALLNLWKLAYTESIFIAFLVIFAMTLHHRIKKHSLLSEILFYAITSPNATRFELTIAEGFSNGWTKRLTLLTYLLLQSTRFVVVLVVARTRYKTF